MIWLESNGRWQDWVFYLGPVGMHGTPRSCLLGRETPQFWAKQETIWQLWRAATISKPRVGLPKKVPLAVLLKALPVLRLSARRFCVRRALPL